MTMDPRQMAAPVPLHEAIERDFRIFSARVETDDWQALIHQLLPDQGAIEVQRDVPGKEHAWHAHDTDETLVILEGGVRFYWEGGETTCGPGTVIALPAGMRHGSVALARGAVYLIAFHDAKLVYHG